MRYVTPAFLLACLMFIQFESSAQKTVTYPTVEQVRASLLKIIEAKKAYNKSLLNEKAKQDFAKRYGKLVHLFEGDYPHTNQGNSRDDYGYINDMHRSISNENAIQAYNVWRKLVGKAMPEYDSTFAPKVQRDMFYKDYFSPDDPPVIIRVMRNKEAAGWGVSLVVYNAEDADLKTLAAKRKSNSDFNDFLSSIDISKDTSKKKPGFDFDLDSLLSNYDFSSFLDIFMPDAPQFKKQIDSLAFYAGNDFSAITKGSKQTTSTGYKVEVTRKNLQGTFNNHVEVAKASANAAQSVSYVAFIDTAVTNETADKVLGNWKKLLITAYPKESERLTDLTSGNAHVVSIMHDAGLNANNLKESGWILMLKNEQQANKRNVKLILQRR